LTLAGHFEISATYWAFTLVEQDLKIELFNFFLEKNNPLEHKRYLLAKGFHEYRKYLELLNLFDASIQSLLE
jgi:hypothetical protein